LAKYNDLATPRSSSRQGSEKFDEDDSNISSSLTLATNKTLTTREESTKRNFGKSSLRGENPKVPDKTEAYAKTKEVKKITDMFASKVSKQALIDQALGVNGQKMKSSESPFSRPVMHSKSARSRRPTDEA
jgi:hypothetical protein